MQPLLDNNKISIYYSSAFNNNGVPNMSNDHYIEAQRAYDRMEPDWPSDEEEQHRLDDLFDALTDICQNTKQLQNLCFRLMCENFTADDMRKWANQ